MIRRALRPLAQGRAAVEERGLVGRRQAADRVGGLAGWVRWQTWTPSTSTSTPSRCASATPEGGEHASPRSGTVRRGQILAGLGAEQRRVGGGVARGCLNDLVARGPRAPALFFIDGNPGFAAPSRRYGRGQRCNAEAYISSVARRSLARSPGCWRGFLATRTPTPSRPQSDPLDTERASDVTTGLS